MRRIEPVVIRKVAVAAMVAAVAACTTAPPPPPPPPPPAPPPVAVVIPPRPTPPHGAIGTMIVPPIGADGVRQTVNAHLTPAQMTWNLRSALNVAALNCLEAEHAGILSNYKVFLTTHAGGLAATNKTVAGEFRKKFGASYRDMQDSYMTQVYNYFALPPALDNFCDMSLTVSDELRAVPKGQLDAFAAGALPRIEGVFENFYRSYEQYRVDVAAWDARYGRAGGSAQNYTSAPQSLGAIAPGGATAATLPLAVPPAGQSYSPASGGSR